MEDREGGERCELGPACLDGPEAKGPKERDWKIDSPNDVEADKVCCGGVLWERELLRDSDKRVGVSG